ncbi:autophagy-related protein 13 homolog [Hyposmocoma kahamanoa]|uniref:autophagy-related protein 13 homolog n=1 Tax=Hyposmocoma kahamanoa TaxID=1477025 RepID=UPI000E6D60CC|nr:autophagy-related protein 13 homolog [Hyposmocoma kahamanoa]
MASSMEAQERAKLYKFTKILALKVAQVVVQSRQGKKITQECNDIKPLDNGLSSSPTNLQWFNLSIPDEPDVNCDTKKVLNGEVVAALSNVLCIEISLKTAEGDEMVLEMWTVKMAPGCDPNMSSVSTIYYRMSIMLKSTLSISRITPAYKMSRLQNRESYKVFHKIYGGSPNTTLLGEQFKTIKVSELRTLVGTLVIEVMYRTKMTILPDNKQRVIDQQSMLNSDDIMVKSDHFPMESPRKHHDKKEVDLTKPLTAGAFVDTEKIKELHVTLNKQLPPEPPLRWLLAEKEKMENKANRVGPENMNINKPGVSTELASSSVPYIASKAIEMPKKSDRYTSLMDFPFADGSPITELANFYQECLQAKSASDEWTDIIGEVSVSTDSESLSQQLKMYEDAVPEFDSMVASMFSNSDNGSDS